jgi:DNA polymerase type B, organellar and viral
MPKLVAGWILGIHDYWIVRVQVSLLVNKKQISMKNIKLWETYMQWHKTMNFMKWGYLVSKVLVKGNWVFTIVGTHGFTYIITEMKGCNLVKVLHNNKDIYNFTDVIEHDNPWIFYRYIKQEDGQEITLFYNLRSVAILTGTKYMKPALPLISIPKPFLISGYNYLWAFLTNRLTKCQPDSKQMRWIDAVLQYIIDIGYYPFINTGLTINSIEAEYDNMELTISNTGALYYMEIYIALFYLIKSNKLMTEGRVAIATAHTLDKEFNLHSNVLWHKDITLSYYLKRIAPNYDYLLRSDYLEVLISLITLRVWDITAKSNIKVPKSGAFKPRYYSTKVTNKSISLKSPKPIINKKSINNKDITPLILKNDVEPMDIFTLDIETMKHPLLPIQVPTIVTIAHVVDNEPIVVAFHVQINEMLSKSGLDGAIANMWYYVFSYLNDNVTNNHVIFAHNLGGFDGYFILKALLLQFGLGGADVVIDKDHDFIQILGKLKDVELIFKDSYRVFGVSLNNLCYNFGVEGKISTYNQQWQDINILSKHEELTILLDYAKQDALSLLLALLKAQDIYLKTYNIDIGSIWSTATLSLKIFRTKFLTSIIPALDRNIDKYVRDGYYGGATDCFQRYGENLYYYDVNSLYPYAMLNYMPLDYDEFHPYLNSLDNFFGFCLVHIECPKDINIPLLPHRMNSKIIYPTWTGTYFSEILKEAMKHGYKITPINGHSFYKVKLFNEYLYQDVSPFQYLRRRWS